MNPTNQICKYFQQGSCKFGDKCRYIHPGVNNQRMNNSQIPQMNTPMNSQMEQSSMPLDNDGNAPPTMLSSQLKVCSFFLKGKCTNQNCSFFHGYGTNLQNISTEVCHQKPIHSIVAISDTKFVTADENSFKIWLLHPKFTCFQEQLVEGKMTKLIYSKGKIIYSNIFESMLSTKSKINVFMETTQLSCDCALEKIDDFIEVENYIICTGKGMIEVFLLGDNGLTKANQISLQSDEITTIVLIKQLFFCGHLNGVLSIWKPGQNAFLQCDKSSKVHDDCINKICIKTVNEYSNYVITCSKDKFIKVFNLEADLNMIFVKQFSCSVHDVFNVTDFEGKDCFIVSLSDGSLSCVNGNFENLFEIKSRNNYIGPRYSLKFTNPFQNETLGNFLIITDGGNLDVNCWIKEGSFITQKKNNHPHPQHNNRGGYYNRGGRGHFNNYRGRGGY